MTDKQIIDGVDVSKCIFFSRGITHNLCKEPQEVDEECKYNPNCYYKQLKRKEQECERLKHDNDYEVGALEKTIDNLKAENKKLEQNLAEIKDFVENEMVSNSDTHIILQLISEVEE